MFLPTSHAAGAVATLVDGASIPSFTGINAITPVPPGFGSVPTGDFLVATFGNPAGFSGFDSKLWRVPEGGGAPTLFADTVPDANRRAYRGGLFP